MLTETEKAYLAGFLDADGCINISCHVIPGSATPSHFLQVTIAQANGPFLDKWCSKVGLGKVYRLRTNNPQATKKMYQWIMQNRQAETFLKWILDYLDIKLDDADIALMFRTTLHNRKGGRITPPGIIRLRKQYQAMLQQVKRDRGEPLGFTEEIEDYERLVNSQLCLF